jgi:hypothetical protein
MAKNITRDWKTLNKAGRKRRLKWLRKEKLDSSKIAPREGLFGNLDLHGIKILNKFLMYQIHEIIE